MTDQQRDIHVASTEAAEVREDSPASPSLPSPGSPDLFLPVATENPPDSLDSGSITSDGNDWLITQIIHAFEPVRPYYDSLKSYNKLTRSLCDVLEKLCMQVITMLSLLTVPSGQITSNSSRMWRASPSDVFSCEMHRIVRSVYRIWFVSRNNIRKSVDCMANIFEEVVPLLPGDEPWNTMDRENKSIRELCFVATMQMVCRLLSHFKNFIDHALAFFGRKSDLQVDK